MGSICSIYGKEEIFIQILICQPEEKRPLGTAGVYVGE
jgi:hypothetical protein